MLAPRQELKCAPQGLAVALAESIASFPLAHKGHGYSFYSLGDETRQDHVGMGKASEVLWGGVGVGVPCVHRNLVWGITGISARTRNLPFVTSSKTVLGKGSDADEGKSLMFCPRISVLSPACLSVIGNELCLVQREPLSECKHPW